MRFFGRKRALDDFMDAVRPELGAIETPRPSQALKTRILASREAGVRVILPDASPSARRSTRAIVAIAITAALVVTLIPVQLRRAKDRAADVFVSPQFFGQVALALTVRDGDGPRVTPARIALAGKGLRAMSLVFSRRLQDSTGRLLTTGSIALAMRDVSLDGVRAWRVESVDHNRAATPAQVTTDTTYLSAADARLLRRDFHVEPYSRFQRINVSQRFTSLDSVSGHMTTDGPSIGEGRSFRRRLDPAFAPYLSESVAPVFLMAARLDRHWRGRASLLGWAVRDDDVSLPIELSVEGEEVVTVPAGRFDCWRLSLRFAGRRIDYWARKSDGLGVRVLDPRDARTGGSREIVLMEER